MPHRQGNIVKWAVSVSCTFLPSSSCSAPYLLVFKSGLRYLVFSGCTSSYIHLLYQFLSLVDEVCPSCNSHPDLHPLHTFLLIPLHHAGCHNWQSVNIPVSWQSISNLKWFNTLTFSSGYILFLLTLSHISFEQFIWSPFQPPTFGQNDSTLSFREKL